MSTPASIIALAIGFGIAPTRRPSGSKRPEAATSRPVVTKAPTAAENLPDPTPTVASSTMPGVDQAIEIGIRVHRLRPIANTPSAIAPDHGRDDLRLVRADGGEAANDDGAGVRRNRPGDEQAGQDLMGVIQSFCSSEIRSRGRSTRDPDAARKTSACGDGQIGATAVTHGGCGTRGRPERTTGRPEERRPGRRTVRAQGLPSERVMLEVDSGSGRLRECLEAEPARLRFLLRSKRLVSETIEDLVGPEALETLERLVDRLELASRCRLFDRTQLVVEEAIDDVGDPVQSFGQPTRGPSDGRRGSARDGRSRPRPASEIVGDVRTEIVAAGAQLAGGQPGAADVGRIYANVRLTSHGRRGLNRPDDVEQATMEVPPVS